jgi:hypothetical protein
MDEMNEDRFVLTLAHIGDPPACLSHWLIA